MTDENQLEVKRFSKNDEGFTCAHCGKWVPPLGYSSRNHCPFCLWSLHVDINPGDRANPCRGQLEPISCEPDAKRGFIIVSKCRSCGEIRRCRAALGAADASDDKELLIRLTAAGRAPRRKR